MPNLGPLRRRRCPVRLLQPFDVRLSRLNTWPPLSQNVVGRRQKLLGFLSKSRFVLHWLLRLLTLLTLLLLPVLSTVEGQSET